MSKPYIGGQAVIEGVMMRSPGYCSVAVRLPQGGVEIKREKVPALSTRFRILGLPVLRGAATLFHMLYLGMKALYFSADRAMEEPETAAGTAAPPKKPSSIGGKVYIAVSLVLSIIAGVALFIWLPLFLASVILSPPGSWAELVGIMHRPKAEATLLFNVVDGLIRVLILVGYIAALTLWSDFRRIFQYHGAEHKTIHTYENHEPITVANARKYSTVHPRCGTSFLFVVMVVSILVFSVIRSDLFLIRFGSRILLLPLIAGIAYEFTRFAARRRDNAVCRFLMQPGYWLQRLSTREPTDDMLEVAIGALNAVLDLEQETAQPAGKAPVPVGTG